MIFVELPEVDGDKFLLERMRSIPKTLSRQVDLSCVKLNAHFPFDMNEGMLKGEMILLANVHAI